MSIIPVKPTLKMAAATSDKRLVRSKSGLKIVSLSTDVVSPLTLDEPQWSPDSEVSVMRSGVLVLQKKRLKSHGFVLKFTANCAIESG